MSPERSGFSIFVDDPRWQAGGVLTGIGVVLWLRGTPGVVGASEYVAGSLVAAGFLLVALAVIRAAMLARVSRNGAEARGRVTRISRLWPTNTYALRYRFADSSGVEVEGREFLSQADAFCWRVGNEGEVRFDPGDPAKSVWLDPGNFAREVSAPQAAAPRAAPPLAASLPSASQLRRRCRSIRWAFILALGFLLCLFFLAAGVVIAGPDQQDDLVYYAIFVMGVLGASAFKLRSGLVEVAEKRRVLRDGAAAEATVIQVEEKFLRGRGFSLSLGWIVSYSYLDRTGRMHFGDSGFLRREEAARWRTGDRCPVLLDPEVPASSVWAG